MLAAVIAVVEALLLIGSLIDFGNLRLIAGRDFGSVRKILAGQAVLVLILIIFLQLVGTASGQQRDGARKTLAGRLGAAIQSYTANSNSVQGFTCTGSNYCNGITDPDTSKPPVEGDAATSTSGVVYTLGKNCRGSSSPTAYAIYYWQERVGASECLDAS